MRSVAIVVIVGGLLTASALRAERFFGTGSFTWQQITLSNSEQAGEQSDVTDQQRLNLGYEDDLFTKNRMLLTANISRQNFAFADYSEFRPIFYLDITSAGYAFAASYSPYKRLSTDPSGTRTFYQYYRDFRGSANFAYDRYPTLGFTHTRNRTFDDDSTRSSEATGTNTLLGSTYSMKNVSAQASYSSQSSHNDLPLIPQISTRSLNGTIGWNGSSSRLGSVSTTYSLFGTRRYSNDALARKSLTNALAVYYALPGLGAFSGSASYSGRFSSAQQDVQALNATNEIFSGQLAWSPLGYFSADATKGYQSNYESGDYEITEYLTLGGTITRYLRHGVDSRLTYSHTMFQQSSRAQIREELGLPVNNGAFNQDSWTGAASTSAMNYVKIYTDGTLTRDSDPISEAERYQMRGSLDIRLSASRTLDCRFGYSTSYQGAKIRFGHAFANTYNVGVVWIPQSNLNLNLNYIATSFNAVPRTTANTLSLFGSYSFRRAFTLNVAFNQQEQKVIADGLLPETRQPRNVNGQLLMYLSQRTTLTLSYVNAKTPVASTNPGTESQTVQATLNTNW